LIPPQQQLYNGLARPADYSILAREWTRRLRASPCWHRNGLACTDSVLAYGQRDGIWPADVGTGQTSGRTTGQTRWKHSSGA